MLKNLNIENIAVIEKSSTDLFPGFNVLTGETGAGKSILIDAINAVLGERTSKELIRNNCQKAIVSALFSELTDEALKIIGEQGFGLDEDGNLFVQRILSMDGKNVCRVNGVQTTVSVLREIGKVLINIHGQHDNQALLNPESHIYFLDGFADISEDLEDYRTVYNDLKSIKKELIKTEQDKKEKESRQEFLKFQIDEISDAKITVGEIEQLTKKRDAILNTEKILEAISSAHTSLSGDDDFNGSVSMIEAAASGVASVKALVDNGDYISSKLAALGLELSEISSELRNIMDETEFDSDLLEQIEERLDCLYRITQKYGKSEQDILDFFDKISEELKNIELSNERYNELMARQQVLEEIVYNKGQKLTVKRSKASEKFNQSVCDILKYLEMPNVEFVVDIKKGIYTKLGCDKVEFLISANIGEPPKPLMKIASGGELSRIMLAIKSVLNTLDSIDTLIFDEIDTGISGKAAGKVGIQLKKLSKSHQVICVTHLAQIASLADNHMLIEKQVEHNKTYTSVTNITGDTRIKEIARIMSGDEITENLYNSAKELIEKGAAL
ncbi:MAG: DNA repair protein RecN [Oscillospiraceae bacterium]